MLSSAKLKIFFRLSSHTDSVHTVGNTISFINSLNLKQIIAINYFSNLPILELKAAFSIQTSMDFDTEHQTLLELMMNSPHKTLSFLDAMRLIAPLAYRELELFGAIINKVGILPGLSDEIMQVPYYAHYHHIFLLLLTNNANRISPVLAREIVSRLNEIQAKKCSQLFSELYEDGIENNNNLLPELAIKLSKWDGGSFDKIAFLESLKMSRNEDSLRHTFFFKQEQIAPLTPQREIPELDMSDEELLNSPFGQAVEDAYRFGLYS